MSNMPNITYTEASVVLAAVAVLIVGPVLVAWTDERRRRRQERLVTRTYPAYPVAMATAPPESMTSPPADSAPGFSESAPQPSDEAASGFSATPLAPEAPSLSIPENRDTVAEPAGSPPAVESGTRVASTPLELQPIEGAARHHFRLDDLHQARLPDWPPPAIRDEPERIRQWQEAELSVREFWAAIGTATIWSPYPARASCLAAAEINAERMHLRYLLFPILWPVAQNQAVAQAVFEIDRVHGSIRGWVDALREQELTEENRREIRDSGGEG